MTITKQNTEHYRPELPKARMVLDTEQEKYGMLTVYFPTESMEHPLWKELVHSCHTIAGENGTGIRFMEVHYGYS